MSWEDRITEAVYTSPSGKEFIGIFEDVSKKIIKKTTPFDFPDVDGTFVQDLGKKGRRYPMRWIFSGEDYDQIAELFDTALEEKGPGILQHPLYGTFDVVPVGEINRSDNLVTAANQAVYDITFFETIKIIFPISDLSAENAINSGITDFSTNAVDNYDDSLDVSTAQEITGYIDTAKAAIRKVKKSMAKIAATTASVERAFNDAFSVADDAIEILNGGGPMLALTRIPSQASANIQSKLASYGDLLTSLITGPSNQFSSGLDSQASNAFLNNNIIASTVVIASIESTISEFTFFKTRSETIAAIEALDALITNYIDWSDTNRDSLDLIDTGEAYQQLLEVFSISQGRLTQIAFTALQERTVILDRDRTFIDFCAEYYGRLDEDYDFVIQSCNLSGIELWELKKGRSMVYYVG